MSTGPSPAPIRSVLIAAACTAIALVATFALLGVDASTALSALWRGSFGTWYAMTSGTPVRAVPLILAGLAVAIAFRAGVFNIGAEGQLLAGAAAAAAVAGPLGEAGVPGAIGIPLTLAAGVLAGGAWAGIAAAMRVRFGVLEVITTILLNFVALHLVGFLVRGPLQEPTGIYPQTASIDAALRLPLLLSGARMHLGLVLAVVIAIAVWWYLRDTAGGFRLRAVGANPAAAASAGRIDVGRVTTGAFLVSGGIAGLAGAVELTGVTYALYENISPGYGYTAIAVALLARLHPLGVLAAGALFGAVDAGAASMQRDAGVPSVIVYTITAVVILGVVAAARRKATP